MAFLTDEDRQKVSTAIGVAESRTSGELVAVVARQSDSYLYIPTLWASFLALASPLPLWFLIPSWGAVDLYTAQLAIFIVVALVFLWRPLRFRLIPRSVKHRRAARTAREQFVEQGLHRTAERTGILIFVSVAEHYVEVLADSGINDKVDSSVWQKAVDDFTANVKAGRVAEGFLAAIADCGDVLAEHFPRPGGRPEELPNRLIEI